MEYIVWYFFSITFISLFCLGWRAVTDTGKILYFIRAAFESKPIGFEEINYLKWNSLSREEQAIYIPSKNTGNTSTIIYRKQLYSHVPWWSQPLVKCVACMPSFWGTVLYFNLSLLVARYIISDIDWSVIIFFYIPIIISCSFINGLFWKSYSK